MRSAGASPYATKDARAHARALGSTVKREVHEFYGPFTMVPGVAEIVRITSPGYGEMDTVVALYDRPPLHVYVNSDVGQRFLGERFPNVEAHRVGEHDLRVDALPRGMAAELSCDQGPLRNLALVVRAHADSEYKAERYEAPSVWDSPLTCHGIDMRVTAHARGLVQRAGKKAQVVDQDATLFRGSYGRIAPAP